jgi:hypothetical protein
MIRTRGSRMSLFAGIAALLAGVREPGVEHGSAAGR